MPIKSARITWFGACDSRQRLRRRGEGLGRLCIGGWKGSCRLISGIRGGVEEVCRRGRGRERFIVIFLRSSSSISAVLLHFLIRGHLEGDSSSAGQIRFGSDCSFRSGVGRRARRLCFVGSAQLTIQFQLTAGLRLRLLRYLRKTLHRKKRRLLRANLHVRHRRRVRLQFIRVNLYVTSTAKGTSGCDHSESSCISSAKGASDRSESSRASSAKGASDRSKG